MTDASAPVCATASATVLNTGRPRCCVPPLPGVTPPTTLVPYSSICSAWKVPCEPVKPWTITFVFLLIKTDMGRRSLLAGDGSNRLLRAVVDVVGRSDGQTRVLQQFLAGFHVRAFEADDDGNLDVDFLDRADDALGDHVAADDAAEDVDEDRLHLVARQDQLEGFGDAFLGGAAADVEEVGRRAAIERDHVHRGHRQAAAVDHAADVAVHGDVVEIVLAG